MTRIAPLVAIAALALVACPGKAPSPCPIPCGDNASCNAATAHCLCNPGFASCGSACVSLPSDPHNCGSCGMDCGGLDCVLGTCGCAQPKVLCAANGASYCADVAHDIDNCGGCGTLCGDAGASEATRAAAWQCFSDNGGPGVCTCNGHFQSCQVPGSALPDCIDVSADSKNCGACGRICAGGTCKADACNCNKSGYVACAKTTDATDPNWCHLALTTDTHCGDADPDHCGVDCTKLNSVCSAGLCVCAPGYLDCPVAGGNQCVDVSNDRYDCGACGHQCIGGACSNQTCDCSAPGYVACMFTTSTSDPEWCHLPELSAKHCGNASSSGCGVDCTSSGVPTAFCSGGQCGCLLQSGDAGTLCPPDGGPSGFCADVLEDPLNCGGCYAPVPAPYDVCYDGLPSCDLGRGEQLCALPTTSFCTNINVGDPAHCGACSGPTSDCDTWNGTNSICESASCHCPSDVTTANGGKPDGGPASHCILSATQGQCTCDVSQHCLGESASLSWGHDIFPLFQTGPAGATSPSKLGCSASGCHTGGESQAAGHLDLSDLDAGYIGLMTGPIFGGKTCANGGPPTTGTFDCPCVAAALPDPKDPTKSSVLMSILSFGAFPQMCVNQLVHNDAANARLVFSPCAQLIVQDWIDAGALP